MADMKVFRIEADTKAAVKNLKDVEIQAVKVITAQEILQGLLTSPEPLKNMEKYIPVYKRIGDITESISKMIPSSVKQVQEAQALVDKGIAKQLEGSKKISDTNKKELDEIKKKVQTVDEQNERLRKEKERLLSGLAKAEKEYNEASIAQYKEHLAHIEVLEKEQTEIAEQQSKKRREILTNTFDDMRKATDDAYAQSISSINLKYDLEAQQIRNSCDLTLAAENEKMGIKKASAENEQAMLIAQNIKLKDLEDRKNTELKKAEQEHQKANASVVDNYLKERSANLTVHVDSTTKKIEKGAKKTVEELSDFFKDVDKETMASITKQAAETVKATTATKEATTATKEATDATKKYVDIQETRGRLTGHIKELEDAKQVYEKRIKLYDLEIINAGESFEKQKELREQKANYIKQNAADIIKIHQALTVAEKQQQDLSMLQWTQYAQKAGEVANSIKDVTGKVGDYLSTAFTAVSNVYKAEIAGIEEEITHLKAKNAEVIQEAESQAKKITALDAEQKNASAAGMTELSNNLLKQIEIEKGAYQESLKTKNEIEAKERELQAKKAKKQAEQEKIEKLNRKATLIKNIGEATSNVAQGVTKALSYGPFLGPVLAAIVAAAGAVQIGIMTKQLVKFADGGLLNGKRHSQGGMRIEGTNMEVEGGEYVVNRESTSKNLGLVRYINSERRELKPTDIESFFARSSQGFEPSFRRMFEDGGQLPAANPNSSIDNEALIYAIKNIRIEPRVAVSDIHRVQDSMVSVDGWTGV